MRHKRIVVNHYGEANELQRSRRISTSPGKKRLHLVQPLELHRPGIR